MSRNKVIVGPVMSHYRTVYFVYNIISGKFFAYDGPKGPFFSGFQTARIYTSKKAAEKVANNFGENHAVHAVAINYFTVKEID